MTPHRQAVPRRAAAACNLGRVQYWPSGWPWTPKAPTAKPQTLKGSFQKLGVPYFGVLIIRMLLLFRVLYWGPRFRKPQRSFHNKTRHPTRTNSPPYILHENPDLNVQAERAVVHNVCSLHSRKEIATLNPKPSVIEPAPSWNSAAWIVRRTVPSASNFPLI